jgi:2-polyprenyl-3-methyl-5-hydroxy-6-metoxy-1,4-benzoquinol methylase
MISVILYGRNDAHGYNLHRRAALSLNCIAEVLTDPEDELIFVDYNTPDELPTFIESISDTLTERCLNILRVLRVPAAIHDQRFAERTHLPAIEPVARNAAARRANPANRWLLSTNTDMIFVPTERESMSEICRDLADGFYALPRFELPEWLWEWLPRSDPQGAIAEIGRLGPRIRLDEPTMSHEWIRFDAPGDFQLMLRDDFVAVDGFDEEMLLGYHVDSNLSRRLLLQRGAIETLEAEVGGYHCNHNRTRTVYHGSAVSNDLEKFFYAVDEAALPAQRSSWGLSDVTLEEVPIRHGVGARCAAVLSDLVSTGARSSSDAYTTPYSLTYDSGHVAAYVVDTLVVSSLDARIGYLGANPILERILADAVDRLGFQHPMAVARFDDRAGVEEIAQSSDVFIIDLGVDGADADDALVHAGAETDLSGLPDALVASLRELAHVIDVERARYEQVKHPRTMMLVNSSAAFCDAYVRAQFDCSYTTIHSRVRRATVKPAHEADTAELDEWVERAYRLLRWARRHEGGETRLTVRPGETIEFAKLDDYPGFGRGWFPPEEGGCWTDGPRSELRIEVDELSDGDCVLTLMVGIVCVAPDDVLRVALLANGEQVAAREFVNAPRPFPWRVELPAGAWAARETDLTLLVDEPRSPLDLGWSEDARDLGIHIRSLAVGPIDHGVRVGETIVFSDQSGADRLLGQGWSTVEPAGVWTVGEEARLKLRLTDGGPADHELVLDARPFVTRGHSTLEVEVWARNECIAVHTFRYLKPARRLRVPLATGLIDTDSPAPIDLRVREGARPVDLGVSNDPRLLGLHLRSLTVGEAGAAGAGNGHGPSLRKLRRTFAVNGERDGTRVISEHCIACGGRLSTPHRLGAATLAACVSCGSRTAVPRPSLAQAAALHDSEEYFEKEYFDARRDREAVTERRARRILELVAAEQPGARLAGARVLDIGCDTGEFASALARLSGAEAYGVDVAQRPLRRAQELGLEVSHGDLSLAPSNFQDFALVTAIDVIEHVPDPGALLEEVRRRLARGGLVYLETPNWRSAVYEAGSLAALAVGSRPTRGLERLFPPEHVQYFTPEGLRALARRAGFRPVALFVQPLRREALAAGPLVAAGMGALQSVDRLTGREILLSVLLEPRKPVR